MNDSKGFKMKETNGKVIKLTHIHEADAFYINQDKPLGKFDDMLMWLPLTQVKNPPRTVFHVFSETDFDLDYFTLTPYFWHEHTKKLYASVFLAVKFEIVSEHTITDKEFEDLISTLNNDAVLRCINTL